MPQLVCAAAEPPEDFAERTAGDRVCKTEQLLERLSDEDVPESPPSPPDPVAALRELLEALEAASEVWAKGHGEVASLLLLQAQSQQSLVRSVEEALARVGAVAPLWPAEAPISQRPGTGSVWSCCGDGNVDSSQSRPWAPGSGSQAVGTHLSWSWDTQSPQRTSVARGYSRVSAFKNSLLERSCNRVINIPTTEAHEPPQANTQELQEQLQPPRQPPVSWNTFIHRMVRSPGFEVFAAVMIMTNVCLVGAETQNYALNGTESVDISLATMALNCWYLLELVLRIIEARTRFFDRRNKDFSWNIFDTILAFSSIADLVSEISNFRGLEIKSLRVFRLIRVTRVVRMGRLLRHLRELHKMAFSLACSMQTLFWSVVLLLSLIYSFAIWITAGVAIELRERSEKLPADTAEQLHHAFGSLFMSVYTLYSSVADGIHWSYVCEPLMEANWTLGATFLTYISITTLGVLNIVTSVFVESAMQSIHHSRDLMVQEKMLDKETYANHIRSIFKEIDTDRSGNISLQELTSFLKDSNLGLESYFEALELDASDVEALFSLLDLDGSGCIGIDEFCDGCLQLKGEAKSYDLKLMMHETLSIQRNLSKFMSHVTLMLHQIASSVDQTEQGPEHRRDVI